MRTTDRAGMALVLGGGSCSPRSPGTWARLLTAFAELDLTAQQAALLMHAHQADSSPPG